MSDSLTLSKVFTSSRDAKRARSTCRLRALFARENFRALLIKPARLAVGLGPRSALRRSRPKRRLRGDAPRVARAPTSARVTLVPPRCSSLVLAGSANNFGRQTVNEKDATL